jgi:hypothetical protein
MMFRPFYAVRVTLVRDCWAFSFAPALYVKFTLPYRCRQQVWWSLQFPLWRLMTVGSSYLISFSLIVIRFGMTVSHIQSHISNTNGFYLFLLSTPGSLLATGTRLILLWCLHSNTSIMGIWNKMDCVICLYQLILLLNRISSRQNEILTQKIAQLISQWSCRAKKDRNLQKLTFLFHRFIFRQSCCYYYYYYIYFRKNFLLKHRLCIHYVCQM